MVDVEKLIRKKNVYIITIMSAVAENERNLLDLDEENVHVLKASISVISKKLEDTLKIYERIIDELDDEEIATRESGKCYKFEVDVNRHLSVAEKNRKNKMTVKTRVWMKQVKVNKMFVFQNRN